MKKKCIKSIFFIFLLSNCTLFSPAYSFDVYKGTPIEQNKIIESNTIPITNRYLLNFKHRIINPIKNENTPFQKNITSIIKKKYPNRTDFNDLSILLKADIIKMLKSNHLYDKKIFNKNTKKDKLIQSLIPIQIYKISTKKDYYIQIHKILNHYYKVILLNKKNEVINILLKKTDKIKKIFLLDLNNDNYKDIGFISSTYYGSANPFYDITFFIYKNNKFKKITSFNLDSFGFTGEIRDTRKIISIKKKNKIFKIEEIMHVWKWLWNDDTSRKIKLNTFQRKTNYYDIK